MTIRRVARLFGAAVRIALVVVGAPAARGGSGVIPATPAHLTETGAPTFVVLGPEAMGLSVAPSDLHLLPDGRILAVTPREIAFSDGVRWEAFRAADGEPAIRAQVAVDTDGEIYVGTENGISKLQLRPDARWQLIKATSLPPAEDFRRATMRSVATVNDTWLWYGEGGIAIWRPGQSMRGTTRVPAIDRIFAVEQRMFLSEASQGLVFELDPDGHTRRISAKDSTANEGITAAVNFAPGIVLVGTTSAGLKLFDGTSFRPFGHAKLGEGHRVIDLCATAGGFFAAALDGVGIVFFDREGRPVQTLDRSLDHRLGRPRQIVATPDGIVWVVLNEGLVRTEFPSPVSHFEPLLASGLAYVKPLRHEGQLWVLTDGKVMRAVYKPDGHLERFEEDTPPGSYLFTLDVVGGHLFASNERGLFVHETSGWKLAVPGLVNARISGGSMGSRGWPYVARGEYGFLRETASGFAAERIPAPALADNYNAVAEPTGVVWLELGTGKVGRLDPRPVQPTLQLFGAADGLLQGWIELYILEGVVRLYVPNHIWRYDEVSKKLVEDRDLLARFPQLRKGSGRPVMDAQGRLWYTDGAVHMLERDATTGSYVERKLPISFGAQEFTLQEDGVAWLFANRRFARLDLRVPPAPPGPLRAQITSVQYSASNRRLFHPGAALPPLPHTDNSLVVHFSTPANPFSAPVTFEVLLEGAGTQWVSTGTVGSAAFDRLKEGDYTVRVRPVVGNAPPGAEGTLRFTVKPPWFRTPLAWTLYIVAALGLVAFAAWLPAFLQRRENERLEQLVARRTGELNAINRQLGRQIEETTEKSAALSASEERYRALNADLEHRVQERTAQLSHSNEELRQRESLFRLIFEHAPVGISWKRTDLGEAYHFNPTFRRILELPADTATGYAPLATLVHPEDAPRQIAVSRRVAAGEIDSYNIEQRFVLGSGRLVWGSLSVAVVRDPDGRIVQDIAILEDITSRKQAEQDLANTYKDLVDASRMAGMAEVATGVLHNVGNVLNSLNVSSTVIGTKARHSQADKLAKLAALLHENSGDLARFLTADPKGRVLPDYVALLAQRSMEERDWLVGEVASMQKNIDHIKEIVAMQQGYARVAGVTEVIDAATLFEDALHINAAALTGHQVNVVREFSAVPLLCIEKAKVLQILINLIRNSMFACAEAAKTDASERRVVVRTEPGANGDTVKLSVRDNGVGIPPENMVRIFRHGFTTRANGHGFGLHSSALAAKEMKGALTVHSDGVGQGATFTLELPIARPTTTPDSTAPMASTPLRSRRTVPAGGGTRPAFATS